MDERPPEAHSAPRTMSAFEELEAVELQTELAAMDEWDTCFCPQTHPKPPHPKEEGVTDVDGVRTVDMMSDTPSLDPLGTFDLSSDELEDLDPV